MLILSTGGHTVRRTRSSFGKALSESRASGSAWSMFLSLAICSGVRPALSLAHSTGPCSISRSVVSAQPECWHKASLEAWH